MTPTGQGEWCRQCWPGGPGGMSANPSCPRLPAIAGRFLPRRRVAPCPALAAGVLPDAHTGARGHGGLDCLAESFRGEPGEIGAAGQPGRCPPVAAAVTGKAAACNPHT